MAAEVRARHFQVKDGLRTASNAKSPLSRFFGAVEYDGFLDNKDQFFSNFSDNEDALTDVDKSIQDNPAASYKFSFAQKKLLEKEFNQLVTLLKEREVDENNKLYWLYAYYCSLLLKSHYDKNHYYKPDKFDEYEKLSLKIKAKLEAKPETNDKKELTPFQRVKDDLIALCLIPTHVSEICDNLGFMNGYRIHFVFSRLTVKQSILFSQQMNWIAKNNHTLSITGSIPNAISRLELPVDTFYALSVAIYALRLLLNIAMGLKHTFSESTGRWERAKHEFEKRHVGALNDIAWGLVNFFSNYGPQIGVSVALGNWLTAGFLVFDIGLLVYRYFRSRTEYKSKKQQYKEELRLNVLNPGAFPLAKLQLDELKIAWKGEKNEFYFNIAAAVVLLVGFTLSISLPWAAATPICFMICMLGGAFYLSAKKFGEYSKEAARVAHLEKEGNVGPDLVAAKGERTKKKNQFGVFLAKNIIVPSLFFGLLAVYWPAAIIFIVAFLGYEYYQRHREKNQAAKMGVFAAPKSVPADDVQPLLGVAAALA